MPSVRKHPADGRRLTFTFRCWRCGEPRIGDDGPGGTFLRYEWFYGVPCNACRLWISASQHIWDVPWPGWAKAPVSHPPSRSAAWSGGCRGSQDVETAWRELARID